MRMSLAEFAEWQAFYLLRAEEQAEALRRAQERVKRKR